MSDLFQVERFQALKQSVAGARRILLTGPVDVDGDSVASTLALARGIARVSAAHVDVAGRPGWRYEGLPGAREMVPDQDIRGPYDVAMVLDGDRKRLSVPLVDPFAAAATKVVIDHHESTSPEGYDIAIVDASAGSTCDLVHALLESWGVPLEPDLAHLLYTGIVYDTGGFWHSNTSAETMELAAKLLRQGIDHSGIVVRTVWERRPQGVALMGHVLGRVRYPCQGRVAVGTISLADLEQTCAGMEDMDRIVDVLLYTVGVEVAVLAVERLGGGSVEVKFSFRSRGGGLDVCALAASLHPLGGGHVRAAGVVLPGLLEDALSKVLAAVDARMEAAHEG